jgi:uncharacterized protein YgiM (DUF1202 family)
MVKAVLVGHVIEAMKGLQDPGDAHGVAPEPVPVPPRPAERSGMVTVAEADFLNVRAGSGASTPSVGRLHRGNAVTILGSAMNGPTKWLNIKSAGITGWVADRFIHS